MQTFENQADSEHEGHEPEQARLHVSGVASPIFTQITRQSARGMTVEQALPFLQLHTQVWDDARKPSRIESVSVVVYDGMPRLVLDLAFDDVGEDMSANAASAQEPRRAHAGVVRPRVRVDHTVPFEHAPITKQVSKSLKHAQQMPLRESTQTFSTHAEKKSVTELPAEVAGLKLSVMEQQLLQPKDFVFRTRVAWERAEPHVTRARIEATRLSLVAYAWLKPRILQALALARATAVRLASRIAERARARSRARAALAAPAAAVPAPDAAE